MNSLPTFHLRLFGTPLLERAESAQPLTGRASQRHRVALLALLAMAPGARLSRDKLIAYLWPERDTEGARNLLKVSSYVLRTTLGESAILSEGDDLRLNTEVIGCDATQFEAALEHGEHERALALYKGAFMDGFFLSDAPEFDAWVARERERLAARYGAALEAMAESASVTGDMAGAATWWKLRATQNPYDSRVAIRYMESLEAVGNRAAALQHAAVHQKLLAQELGMNGSAEVSALAERLRTEQPAPSQHTAAALDDAPASSPVPSRAPAPAPPLSPPAAAKPRRRFPARWAAIAVAAALLLAVPLWQWNPAAPAPRERSIVVLPFAHLGPDSTDAFFSDGLTEEIITGLARVPALRVISRTSAMHYEQSQMPVREIAKELNVAHVLEGSVRRDGSRARITAQLIDARVDGHLWARNFDTDVRDVFKVQEEIAREVVRALEVELAPQSQVTLVKQGTRNPDAYALYRRGRHLWNTRTKEGHELAIEYFERAIALDSNYADAYAALADVYFTAYQVNVSSLSESETLAKKRWATEKALALDDESADAHTTFGTYLLWTRNWPGAEREMRRAIGLNPSHATARSWLGLVLSGMGQHRHGEALEESRRAFELDPFAVVASSNYGWQRYLARDYTGAIEQYRRTLEIAPTFGRTYQRLGIAFAQAGMLDSALDAMAEAVRLVPERPDFVADLAWVHALRGEKAAALAALERAKNEPFEPYNIGRAYVGLRMLDSAFAWFERANWKWPHRAVRLDPSLDAVRSDERFVRLSERIDREMGMR